MIRRTLTCALILTLTWTGWSWAAGPAFAQEAPRRLSPEEAMARLDEFMDLIGELRSHIDRSQFDLEALLEKLDYDAESILEFVTNEIDFEQYPGLLRSAQGTLWSRAGNSLDQSVLLARLLKDAGHEARVVRGDLPSEAAARLVDDIPKARQDAALFTDDDAAQRIFTELITLVGLPAAEAKVTLEELSQHGSISATGLRSAARNEAELIQSKLRTAGIELGHSEFLPEIRREARDYFWVQYKLDTPAWHDAHPAFGEAGQPPTLDAVESFADTIPEALQHQMTLQVFLERSIGESVETVPLTDPWTRPAANLTEGPLVFSNTPVRPPGGGTLLEMFTRSDVFVPTLNGTAASELAFDVAGNTIPMMAVQAAASELFQTVSDKGDQATSALASLGIEQGAEKDSLKELRALWVDVKLSTPDGGTQTFRQGVWPRQVSPCGPSHLGSTCSVEDRRSALRHALATQITLATATGSFPSSYVLDKVLERIGGSRPLLEIQMDPERASDLAEWERLEGVDMSWLGYLPLFDAFDHSGSSARIYRFAPSLVAFRQAIDDQGELLVSLDVMTNAKRAIASTVTGAAPAEAELVGEGVWETVMENLFLANSQDEALDRALPITRMGANLEAVTVVQQPSDLVAANLTQQALGSVTEDLERGYSVVIPRTGSVPSLHQVGWYRVDPLTGETLGMTSDGRGGALEYVGKLIVGIFIVAPIYVAGCLLAGGELGFCVMAIGKTAASIGLGPVAVALSVFGAITFSPSNAY